MLQSFREMLTLALIALLPLHALLVTVGTRLLADTSRAPLPQLALWKEAVLGLILLFAFAEWIRSRQRVSVFDTMTADTKGAWDVLDGCIGALVVLSVLLTAFTHEDWGLFALGFKYDLLPLVVFVALRRVPWSDAFVVRAQSMLMFLGGIIAIVGLIGLILPQAFFVALGYSDLHSLYLPDAPLAAFQQIGDVGIRRLQSTFGGPNQAGMWLLFPWSIGWVVLLRLNGSRFWFLVFGLIAVGVALLLTFSRAAWIAAGMILLLALWMRLSGKRFVTIAVRLIGVGALFALSLTLFAPGVVLRIASSRDHLLRPLAAVQSIMEHPVGQGLGTAGPASNRVSDSCVFLEAGADTSWAMDRPDLCVFVAGHQVQPAVPCHCPFLPENWYLQLGVEMGIVGMVLFLVLIACMLRYLWQADRGGHPLAAPVFLVFAGISIAAFVLHAWEDASVAYTAWLLAAVVLPIPRRGV